ncbi:MAG: SRPBCC family protein [Planctomycetes bacterium]|nr:SRPBCC family protein [Planctomycetota bacterium]
MSEIIATIDVARTPEDVFAYLVDPSHAPEWTSGLVSREIVTPPPLGVGSRWRESRRVAGMSHEVEVEVTRHEPPGPGRAPPYVHGGRGETLGVEARFVVTVDALDDGGSRVTLGASIEGRSMFGRPLASRLRRAAEEEGDRPLRRLKQALEGSGRS